MDKDNIVYISVGSNLGDRIGYIHSSINLLRQSPEIEILKISDFFQTKPLEVKEQNDFFNIIIKIKTSMEPLKLLNFLQECEKKIGRIFRFSKGPREIDLDILSYNQLCITSIRLVLPHPALFTRPFIREILTSISEEVLYEYYGGDKFANHNTTFSN